MPLTNDVIIKLNEITLLVEDKESLRDSEISEIKDIFENILKEGQMYDVDEIESWFENEGSWKDVKVQKRLVNLAHYTQSKYQQTDKLRVISDDSFS